jgi:hypothetical protein
MADASMVKTAPRAEKGSPTGVPLWGVLSWAAMGAQAGMQQGGDIEYVPELQWPNSVWTYGQMRNDSQVDGLARGSMLPITRWDWGLAQNNSDPAVWREAMRDLGLPAATPEGDSWKIDRSQPIPRNPGRFDFHEHLTEALLATIYGHYPFEMVADLVPPPDDWPVDTPMRARLHKLATRPPWTLTSIDTDPADGGLIGLRQLSTPIGDPGITADRAVMYVWGKEGANWVGRSMLRSLYRPWLVKDRVIRVGAINIERNGAGVPVITAPPGATKSQIEALGDLATKIRGGDSSGGSIPAGATLNLMGVMGSQPDAVGFMNFLNEEMARAYLQAFQVLGQTATGSRALGQTFLDFFTWALEAIADWFAAIFYKIVIERWMTWNVGLPLDPNVDEFAPRLVYVRQGSPTQALADAANTPPDQGGVQVDQQTKAMLEDPDKDPADTGRRTSRRAAGGHGGRTGAERRAASTGPDPASPVSLPARPLRRQPMDFEVAASTDFAAMDSTYNSALELLHMEVRSLIGYQIQELHDAIVEAGDDLDAISNIAASEQHRDVIASRLEQVAELSATHAVQEAQRQAMTIDRPDTSDLIASLRTRSEVLDRMITRDVTEAAVRRAVRYTGGALDASGVAAQVRDELQSMTWAGVRDQLGAAVQGSQNGARSLVFRRDGQPGQIYASEILDNNTCAACAANDGTNYADMNAAEQDYPFGGYTECAGGGRCRGTLVKVYDETSLGVETVE